MKIIALHASGKALKRDALVIGDEAKRAKEQDNSVINATIGTFIYEDYSFRAFPTVKKILSQLPDDKFYSYSTSDGGKDFKEAVFNWVFGEYRKDIEKETLLQAVATPGGTGAISSSIFNSLDPGQTLLIPSLYWGPYVGIANNYGFKKEKFDFFSEGHFNMKCFREKAGMIIAKQGKLVAVINDPCNNPTGYTLDDSEVTALISYCNSLTVPVVLIYDIAYIDFSYLGHHKVRERFLQLAKANPNVLVTIAFSASKSFAVYGLRLGAQIFMGKDRETMTDFYNSGNYTARNMWSNCNKSLINMMIYLDHHPEEKETFLQEQAEAVGLIKKRSDLFLKEAKEIGLKTHPYKSGFFITIPVENPDAVLDRLIEKEKMYLLPFEKSVRLAVCSLAVKDIPGLASRIKGVIDSIQ